MFPGTHLRCLTDNTLYYPAFRSSPLMSHILLACSCWIWEGRESLITMPSLTVSSADCCNYLLVVEGVGLKPFHSCLTNWQSYWSSWLALPLTSLLLVRKYCTRTYCRRRAQGLPLIYFFLLLFFSWNRKTGFAGRTWRLASLLSLSPTIGKLARIQTQGGMGEKHLKASLLTTKVACGLPLITVSPIILWKICARLSYILLPLDLIGRLRVEDQKAL